MIDPRQRPNALEAEQAVLCAMLISTKAVAKALALIRAEDFERPMHGRIFKAMTRLREREAIIDIPTVAAELRRTGELDGIGGEDYLLLLGDTPATGAHVAHYAAQVLEAAELRRMVDLGEELIDKSFARTQTADELRRWLVSQLLLTGRTDRRQPQRWGEVLMAELERILEMKPEPALLSGIESLDRITGGLGRGDLGIITGRPGTGKSALLLQMMMHGARTWGKGVLVSLEMDATANIRRALANVTGYSYRELRDVAKWEGYQRAMSDDDLAHIARRSELLADLNDSLWIDDSVYELDDLITRVHSLHAQENLGFVAVDYGQLVKTRNDKRNEEVEMTVDALKNRIAKAMRVPCWMISSAGRDVEKRGKEARLKKSDLMWSSSIEFTASCILLLNEDHDYHGPSGTSGVLADVDKSRNDTTGDVPLVFHKARFALTGRDDHHAGQEPAPQYWEDR